MGFILKIFDRKGNELNEGDIVKIFNTERCQFFAEVKFLEKENAIAPFYTFSFSEVEKVAKLPAKAKPCLPEPDQRYKVWYLEDEEESKQMHEQYLIQWLECEYALKNRMFRIERDQKEIPAPPTDISKEQLTLEL